MTTALKKQRPFGPLLSERQQHWRRVCADEAIDRLYCKVRWRTWWGTSRTGGRASCSSPRGWSASRRANGGPAAIWTHRCWTVSRTGWRSYGAVEKCARFLTVPIDDSVFTQGAASSRFAWALTRTRRVRNPADRMFALRFQP